MAANKYVQNKFPWKSEAKRNKDIYVCSQTRKNILDKYFGLYRESRKLHGNILCRWQPIFWIMKDPKLTENWVTTY